MEKLRCTVTDCRKVRVARGWCRMHYARWYNTGTVEKRVFARVCSVPDCGRNLRARNFCAAHWSRWRLTGDPQSGKPIRTIALGGPICAVDGCVVGTVGRRMYCELHQRRLHRLGTPGEAARRSAPKGSRRWIDSNGYVIVSGSRTSNGPTSSGVQEHRLVMSQMLGRPLVRSEHVHHVNGDRADNRSENLELWSTSHPSGQRVQDKVRWAREMLERYGTLYPE